MTNQPLTIEDTINVLGVSDKTVRRMLKDGLLVEHSRDARGRVLVDPSSITRAAEQIAARKGDTDRQHEIQLASQSETLNTTIQRFTEMVNDRDDTILRLTEEVAILRTERQYMVSHDQARELERKIMELEAELKASQRPVTDRPDEPKRPSFLARLLGRD